MRFARRGLFCVSFVLLHVRSTRAVVVLSALRWRRASAFPLCVRAVVVVSVLFASSLPPSLLACSSPRRRHATHARSNAAADRRGERRGGEQRGEGAPQPHEGAGHKRARQPAMDRPTHEARASERAAGQERERDRTGQHSPARQQTHTRTHRGTRRHETTAGTTRTGRRSARALSRRSPRRCCA